MNPFVVPQRERADTRPLCPWKYPEHVSYFVAVDHSEEAFQDFRNKVGDPRASLARANTVIATGGEGCGKTALIHRCADWLDSQLKEIGLASVIVDLTAESFPGLASEARLAHWTERLVDRLGVMNVLDPNLQQNLADRKAEPLKAFPFLADILESMPVTLHLILPGLEVVKEIQRLAGLSRPYLNIYTECSSEDLRRVLKVPGTLGFESVIDLEVDVLTIADGWKFVQARMTAAVGHLGPAAPTINEATMKRYMAERIKGRGTTTIRELNLICAAVFADVQENARNKIEFSDFSAYYLRNGVV